MSTYSLSATYGAQKCYCELMLFALQYSSVLRWL